jgi:hypothetical protein
VTQRRMSRAGACPQADDAGGAREHGPSSVLRKIAGAQAGVLITRTP